jgi:hypothetical protein
MESWAKRVFIGPDVLVGYGAAKTKMRLHMRACFSLLRGRRRGVDYFAFNLAVKPIAIVIVCLSELFNIHTLYSLPSRALFIRLVNRIIIS